MMDAPGKDDTLDLCVIDVSALTTIIITGDFGRAVIDTAAAASVAGGEWTNDYFKQLPDLSLGDFIKEENASEQFRFGDGATVLAARRITAPAVIACKPLKITWFVVENIAVPFLPSGHLDPIFKIRGILDTFRYSRMWVACGNPYVTLKAYVFQGFENVNWSNKYILLASRRSGYIQNIWNSMVVI